MSIKSKLCFVLAMCTLALSISDVFATDLPSVMQVSIQVKPLTAVSSPGRMLSLDVRCEGVKGIGTQVPMFVTGAPDGTSIEIIILSEQRALINLIFPTTAARGVWVLLVKVGSPTPLVEQKVEIEFER